VGAIPSLVEQYERLAVEPGQPDDRPEESAPRKLERDDMILARAIQAIVQPESQPSRPPKPDRTVGREYAKEPSGVRIVFADAGHGVGSAEGVLAGDDDMAIVSERQIKRA